MKKIERRAALCLILALCLFAGLCLFGFRFVTQGGDWAAFPSNRHLYDKSGRLISGAIADRDGDVLSDIVDGERTYYPDATVRKATLHAVGDRQGNIGTGALHAFADHLSGYNLITGGYSPIGNQRTMHLTLDAAFNVTAYKALDGQKGAVGVYDYTTGEILCMVSTPTFDPDNPPDSFDSDKYEGVFLNRFLSAAIVPGSIFKTVTLNAALENIPDLHDRTWKCDGSVTVGGAEITCPSAHGTLDIESAFANSCNGVFGQLAAEMGGETMQKYVDQAGLTSSLSVDGIQTMKGTFSFKGEDKGQIAWGGVGQGKDALNPCSMMTYMGAIAAGGKAAVPRLIESIDTGSILPGGVFTTKQTGELVSEETAATLRKMLRNNVVQTYGEGRFPDGTCAKSGTAEVGGGKTPNAWFAGFIDSPSHPYAFIVCVENGGGGARVAGEVASEVLNTIVDKMG